MKVNRRGFLGALAAALGLSAAAPVVHTQTGLPSVALRLLNQGTPPPVPGPIVYTPPQRRLQFERMCSKQLDEPKIDVRIVTAVRKDRERQRAAE